MGTVHAKAINHPPIPGLSEPEINYTECDDRKSIPLDVPVRVDRINVDGIGRTKEDLIRDVATPLFKSETFKDVLFNAHQVRQKFESLGLFRNIAIHVDVSKGPRSTKDGIEVTFLVNELKRVVGGVNTEVGHNEGSVVVGLRAPNIAGRGERIFVEYSYGSRRSNNFTVGAVKPFAGKLEPRLTASVFQNISEFPASGYKELEKGFSVGGEIISKGDLRHSLLYKGCFRDQGVISKSSSFDVREESGATMKSALQYILNFDRRDDLVFPSCGSTFQLTSELSGLGGNVGFLKNELYGQVNLSVVKDVVLQGTLGLGYLMGLGNDMKIGMSDMFYLGGPLDMRGFHARGIGPRSEGNALGGDAYWIAGLHLFTPLPWRPGKGGFGDIFRTHLFANVGSIATRKSDEEVTKQVQQLRFSTGLGVAIRLGQMARVEINYSVPVTHGEGDVLQQGIQFGIGLNFF